MCTDGPGRGESGGLGFSAYAEVAGGLADDGSGGSDGGSCELGAGSEVGTGRVIGVESGGSCWWLVFAFLAGDFRAAAFFDGVSFLAVALLGLSLVLDSEGKSSSSSSDPEVSSMISSGSTIGVFVAVLPLERIFARSAMSNEKEPMSSSVAFCFPLLVPEMVVAVSMGSVSDCGAGTTGVRTLMIVEVDGAVGGAAPSSAAGRILYAGLGLGFRFTDGSCTTGVVAATIAG